MSNTSISEDMLKRLRKNRHGKLAFAQLRDAATEPLAPLMLLMLPAVILVGRFPITWRGLLYAFMIAIIITLVPGTIRAIRLARKPIKHARLYVENNPPGWMFWRKIEFVKVSGEHIPFDQKLAPALKLERDRAYLVYYLEDGDKRILLSIAPADHPQSQQWQPVNKTGASQAG